jgi:hypothetical protein
MRSPYLKAVAPSNIPPLNQSPMLLTDETFHKLRPPSRKVVAPLNMLAILVTDDVSQDDKFPSKAVAPLEGTIVIKFQVAL